ncbi:hypothetical protein VNO77_38838 [Canavalia gladiata]|uniref:Uncharacterized protein n=1 Tax=Canavalia gladiata TaxID=3824 RepID=A0AAN9KC92_CANGL
MLQGGCLSDLCICTFKEMVSLRYEQLELLLPLIPLPSYWGVSSCGIWLIHLRWPDAVLDFVEARGGRPLMSTQVELLDEMQRTPRVRRIIERSNAALRVAPRAIIDPKNYIHKLDRSPIHAMVTYARSYTQDTQHIEPDFIDIHELQTSLDSIGF